LRPVRGAKNWGGRNNGPSESHARAARDNPRAATGETGGACPGYQIDHRMPLGHGGADEPANMQWLSVDANRAKTARERR